MRVWDPDDRGVRDAPLVKGLDQFGRSWPSLDHLTVLQGHPGTWELGLGLDDCRSTDRNTPYESWTRDLRNVITVYLIAWRRRGCYGLSP